MWKVNHSMTYGDVDLQALRKVIEHKRIVMIQSGKELGLNHKDTVKHSQELDVLLSMYQQILDKTE